MRRVGTKKTKSEAEPARKRRKLTKAERILDRARKSPSRTCHDDRQITLNDFLSGGR